MSTVLKAVEDVFRLVAQTTGQAIVVAGLILVTQWLFRKRLSPAWRYGLWLLLVARLLMPVSFHSGLSIFNLAKFKVNSPAQDLAAVNPQVSDRLGSPVSARAARPVSPPSTPPEPERQVARERVGAWDSVDTLRHGTPWPDWEAVAALVWLLGSGLFGLRLLWSNLWFSSRLARHLPLKDESVRQVFDGCVSALGVRGPVSLIQTTEVDSPAVWGLRHKRVLLPEGFTHRFSADELRCVFLHELAHLKRHDLEINWLVAALQVLHWFNPVVWFCFARMRADRELACDALALLRIGEGKSLSYGETIIKLLETLARPARVPGLLGISQDKRRMKQRIEMIATFKRPTGWSASALGLVGVLAAISLTDASKARLVTVAVPQRQLQEIAPVENHHPNQPGLLGRVLDPDGNPIAGALVKCQGFVWQTITDAQGRFEWKGLDKSYAFTVEKFGFRNQYAPALAPGTDENVITLERATIIGGRVIDRDTRAPIDQFEVYPARTVVNWVKPGINSYEQMAGHAGEFKYSFPDFRPPPDTALYIYAEGYAPQLSRPLTPADDGTEMTFELVKASPIAGNVLTPEGEPAANAEVRLWSGQLNFKDVTSHDRTNTDNHGRFSLPPALDGEITVNHDSGFARASWDQFRSDHTIRLAKWGRIKGHWPKPLPESRRVWLKPIDWAEPFTFQPRWVTTAAQVSASGDFEFEDGVPPGEYKLGEVLDLPINNPGGGSSRMLLSSERVHLIVEAGQTAVVEVPDGVSVVGRVDLAPDPALTNRHLPIVELDSKSAALDFKYPNPNALSARENLVRLQAYREEVLNYWLSPTGKGIRRAERRFKTHTDVDGNFRLEHVPAGDYVLVINAQGGLGGVNHAQFHREISIPSSTAITPIELGLLRLAVNH